MASIATWKFRNNHWYATNSIFSRNKNGLEILKLLI